MRRGLESGTGTLTRLGESEAAPQGVEADEAVSTAELRSLTPVFGGHVSGGADGRRIECWTWLKRFGRKSTV
jgi:hypothetical protein